MKVELNLVECVTESPESRSLQMCNHSVERERE